MSICAGRMAGMATCSVLLRYHGPSTTCVYPLPGSTAAARAIGIGAIGIGVVGIPVRGSVLTVCFTWIFPSGAGTSVWQQHTRSQYLTSHIAHRGRCASHRLRQHRAVPSRRIGRYA
eukprot:118027-Rhodomonas_salina.1